MIGRRSVAARPPVTVELSDEQDAVTVDATGLATLARQVLEAEGIVGPAELSLTFVDEAEMAGLNAEHMDETGPTDVLAFPLYDPDETLPSGMAALLGDVVVCPAVAQRYASDHGRSTDDELSLLVVHGVLHVLGHDHAEAEEAAIMRTRELRHLQAFVDPAFTL